MREVWCRTPPTIVGARMLFGGDNPRTQLHWSFINSIIGVLPGRSQEYYFQSVRVPVGGLPSRGATGSTYYWEPHWQWLRLFNDDWTEIMERPFGPPPARVEPRFTGTATWTPVTVTPTAQWTTGNLETPQYATFGTTRPPRRRE